jgi:hypothetical protein
VDLRYAVPRISTIVADAQKECKTIKDEAKIQLKAGEKIHGIIDEKFIEGYMASAIQLELANKADVKNSDRC